MGEIDLKIAVLSGKGGTGKTFVSVNLAAAAESAVYVDCDVEEPNGHLFFRPNQLAEETVAVQVPAVDPELCTGCRKCVEFCRYGPWPQWLYADDLCKYLPLLRRLRAGVP